MIKYMYLKDPSFRNNRVLTVARRLTSKNEMEVSYCINLVTKDTVAYEDRGFVPNEYVHEVFSKKKGRNISSGRLESSKNCFKVKVPDGERFDLSVLKFLENEAPNHYARKIGKHHRRLKEAQFPS